jgi:hypothetical protein
MNDIWPYILLAAGLNGLNAVFLYAVGRYARVGLLRMELTACRDELWNEAQRRGELDNPQVKDAIARIERSARCAGMYSLPIWRMEGTNPTSPGAKGPISGYPEWMHRIAFEVLMRILSYIYDETWTGKAWLLWNRLWGRRWEDVVRADGGLPPSTDASSVMRKVDVLSLGGHLRVA